ncbi:MAG: response regulator transcription factor [Lachnospiraceae bacterium]|nr:response regulator transcription factor [Lachnospiraceae bacterium]
MRIGICDDERAQQELLRSYVEKWAEDNQEKIAIHCFMSAEEFLFAWEEDKSFDLLILDVEMGEMNGMELAKKLRNQDAEVPILFVTGYERYIAMGYEVSALHYLLKPIRPEKLWEQLGRIRDRRKSIEKIWFQTAEGSIVVPVEDIWYIEADRHNCILHFGEKQQQIKHALSYVIKLLQHRRELVSCHRSLLVNLQHVSMIVKNELVMDNGERLPISRSLTGSVNQAFIRLFQRN